MNQSDVLKLPDGKYLCATGLYLRVRNNGSSRSWVYTRRINGQVITRGLGSAYDITLKQAKAEASKIHAGNINGIATRKIDLTKKFRKFSSHYAMAIEARRKSAGWRNDKHGTQWYNTIRDYVLPVLGDMNLAEISAADVVKVLEPIWFTKNETAKRLRERLEVIFDYFIRQGWRDKTNPAVWKGNLEFDFPPPTKVQVVKHHEAATVEELRRIVPELMKSRIGKAVVFGILTATRCVEFCDALWEEIDLKRKIWTIPPERRKDGKKEPHIVPLSRQAVELLESLDLDSTAVFPGRFSRFISRESPRMHLRRALKRNVTMHGCRSTFRDWAAESGKDIVTAEKCLMHSVGNNVYQAYQRSDLFKRRRQLLQEWSDVVMKNYDKLQSMESCTDDSGKPK